MEFELSSNKLKDQAWAIIERAKSMGATSAAVAINESIETNIDVLKGAIENFETCYSSHMSLSVYLDKNRGSVGISGTQPKSIDSLIQNALELAKYTESDPDNGIAPEDLICMGFEENLELYNPINLSNEKLIEKTINIEHIALNSNKKISNSNGSAMSLGKYNFVIANSNGLNQGYKTTRFDTSISLIGGKQESGMQTDYWYSSNRDFNNLLADEKLAHIAIDRTVRRLKTGHKIKSGSYPVIFEAPIAKGLIGSFLGAISGNNLYRKLSFLNDSLDTKVFPEWMNIVEDPFIKRGLSSCYFDNEGVNVQKRNLVENGTVRGYQLNCYNARKLKMQTTGNSGGNHNIIVSSNFNGDSTKLATEIKKGLLIIETIGHGLNMVTGDYSVGASGLWIENGEIQYFVDNLTIAGNLKDIYQKIKYIGNDYQNSSISCGSILIDNIQVSV